MTSRFWIGTGILTAVTAGVAATAIAQDRMQAFGRLRELAEQRRSRPADPNPTPISAPGDYRFSLVHNGLKRDYLVHVPNSYRPGRAAPMLMALHGGGGTSDFQADDAKYKLISKSEQAGFIAVFPNGHSRLPSGILATWNAGACCGAAVKDKVDDVGFLREVILRVGRQASIDKRRVFVTGMSNGGLMSYRMACEASDLVRAIAPVAGTDNTIACTPARPVPVIHFHAADDDHVLFNGGSGKKALTETNFAAVPMSIAKWVAIDRADPKAKRVVSVSGAHCDLYPAKPGGVPVELCVTDSGGHSWPGGGTQQGRKQPSQAISANDLMWQFFSSL